MSAFVDMVEAFDPLEATVLPDNGGAFEPGPELYPGAVLEPAVDDEVVLVLKTELAIVLEAGIDPTATHW